MGGMTRTLFRWLAAAVFVGAGVKHFRSRDFFQRIVPPSLPRADVLVAVSGACEIAGGLGLLWRPTRRAAGWGLAGLLVAVFPANVYMVLSRDPAVTLGLPRWVLWARLPLQVGLIAWVLWVSAATERRRAQPDLSRV